MSVMRLIEKLKVKEILFVLFVSAILITFMPKELARNINIYSFRELYQTYSSLCIIIIGAYYIYRIVVYCKKMICTILYSEKNIAIRYMKKIMVQEEMAFIVEKFYDEDNNRFRITGYINLEDGRKAKLEEKFIIYRAATVSSCFTTFAYNLQPYVVEFLNENINKGRLQIENNGVRYNLK